MEGATPPGQSAVGGLPGPPAGAPPGGSWSAGGPDFGPPAQGVDWPAWMAPVALIGGLVLAAVGGLVVDRPAIALGAKLTTSHTPPGLAIADTFVQDVAFVLAAAFCAQLGGRAVRAWQLGLRPPRVGWRRAAVMIVGLIVLFIVLN